MGVPALAAPAESAEIRRAVPPAEIAAALAVLRRAAAGRAACVAAIDEVEVLLGE